MMTMMVISYVSIWINIIYSLVTNPNKMILEKNRKSDTN